MGKLYWMLNTGRIRFAAGDGDGGGSGGDNGDQSGDSGEGTPSPADVAARQAAAKAKSEQSQQNDAGDEGGDESPWSDPARAQREIEKLRKEAGDKRVNAKKTAADEARKDLVSELMKVIDPNADNSNATPEQLASQVLDVSTERDGARIDAMVLREAWAAGVDPERVDYLAFKLGKRDAFGELKPDAEDVAGNIKTMVSEEISKDSTLKAAGTRQSSGDSQFGGAGDAKQFTIEEFKGMSMKDRTELYRNNRSEYDRLTALK